MQKWRARSSEHGKWFTKIGGKAEGRRTAQVGEELHLWELRAFSSDCSYFLIEKAKSDLGLRVQMGEAVLEIRGGNGAEFSLEE